MQSCELSSLPKETEGTRLSPLIQELIFSSWGDLWPNAKPSRTQCSDSQSSDSGLDPQVLSHLHKTQFWSVYLQTRAGNTHFFRQGCSKPIGVLRTLGRGGSGQHTQSWVRKDFLHQMEHDTDLAGWEIRASSHLTADVISRALPGDESPTL